MDFQEFFKEWHNEKDFIIAKTSGSTGIPKEIQLPKRFVEESAERTINFFKIKETSRLHSCVGADYIGGKMMAVRADLAGATFSYETPSNEPLKELEPGEILDLVAVVPSQVLSILNNQENLPLINNLLIGGSSIHPDLRKKISQSAINAFESYGMTETASHIALRKIQEVELPFKLLPGISISQNMEGCLLIRFKDGYEIQTNDLVEIISGTEFYIKGRKDQIIISGGKKINPEEVEKKISSILNHPFIITGLPDEKWGEKIVLIIEGANDENFKSFLKNQIDQLLEKWEKPKEILFLEKLPRTSNGKIKRIKSL